MYNHSARFKLIWEDIKRWFHNAKVFSAPLIIMYVTSITPLVTSGAFSFDTFIPSPEIRGAIALYVLNTILDLSKKFVSENGYKS